MLHKQLHGDTLQGGVAHALQNSRALTNPKGETWQMRP
jgi:hypothetical protein